MSPDAALAACRFLHAASLMLVWGGAAYLAWLVPAELAGIVARHLRRPACVVTAVAIATRLAALPIETAEIGDGWAAAADPATVKSVLFDTTVGHGWQMQAAAALLLLLPLALHQGRRISALALTSGLCLASLALSGHAVMQKGFTGAAHMANDALHLLSGGAWLGALVPLLPILLRLHESSSRQEVGSALRRFSSAGHFAVGLVILTGVANMFLVLGRLPTDWSSPYQALLAVKIVAAAIMTALAILNRYVFVPRLSRRPGGMLAAIRIATVAEILLGLLAVLCVAFFGTYEPI